MSAPKQKRHDAPEQLDAASIKRAKQVGRSLGDIAKNAWDGIRRQGRIAKCATMGIAAVGLMAFAGCNDTEVDKMAQPKQDKAATVQVEKGQTVNDLNKRSHELRVKMAKQQAQQMRDSVGKVSFIDSDTKIPAKGVPQWFKLSQQLAPQEKIEESMEGRLLDILVARNSGKTGLDYGLSNPKEEERIFREKEFPMIKKTIGDEKIQMIHNAVK